MRLDKESGWHADDLGHKSGINVNPELLRKLLRELEPEGILLDTICGSEKEVNQLISEVKRWT